MIIVAFGVYLTQKFHIMKRLLLLAITAILASTSIIAHAELFTWSKHNLTFEVPEGGRVTYSSPSTFEIQWYDFTLLIKLYDKSEADDDYMKYAINRTASGYNMFDTDMNKAKMDGFKGYTLTGTLPDGSRASITNVASKKADFAMQVEMNYLAENSKIAEDILKSFKANKPQKIKKPKQKIQKKGEKEKPIRPGTLEGEQLYEA